MSRRFVRILVATAVAVGVVVAVPAAAHASPYPPASTIMVNAITECSPVALATQYGPISQCLVYDYDAGVASVALYSPLTRGINIVGPWHMAVQQYGDHSWWSVPSVDGVPPMYFSGFTTVYTLYGVAVWGSQVDPGAGKSRRGIWNLNDGRFFPETGWTPHYFMCDAAGRPCP